MFVHDSVGPEYFGEKFSSVRDLTGEVFYRYEGLIYIAPCGVAVRAVAPHVMHKKTDPAVVVVDVCGRYAVSLLSGHEGGANDLALAVANIIGAEPVITTTTEALKDIIVGVGCRRGTGAETIVQAVRSALDETGVTPQRVRLIASADLKRDEHGLIAAAKELLVPLRFIASDEIRASARDFDHSEFVRDKVDLPAVAEPSALLAGRRTRLLLTKRNYGGVTVALARENCTWSE